MFFLFLQLHSVFYSCNFIINFFTVLLSHIFYFDKIKKAIFTMSQWTENIKFHFTFSLSEKAHFENLLLIPPMCNSHYDVNCIYFETFVGICCNVYTTYFVSPLLTISLVHLKILQKELKLQKEKFIN